MKFEGREIDDQVIDVCRQRMSESEFGRKDLLAILRSFRLSPDLAERIAENLIHEAGVNGEIASKENGPDESTWTPAPEVSPSRKTATGSNSKNKNTKSKNNPASPRRKPLLPSAQLDLFAEV